MEANICENKKSYELLLISISGEIHSPRMFFIDLYYFSMITRIYKYIITVKSSEDVCNAHIFCPPR